MTAEIEYREAVVVEPDPALPLAIAWAGDNEDRWQIDVLAAFVHLVHVLDQYQREAGDVRLAEGS